MAFTASIRRQRKEPWGWESAINIIEDGQVVQTVTVLDKVQKTEQEFIDEGRFARLIQNHQDDVAEKAAEAAKAEEKVYTESEVTAILKEKGYITDKEVFSEAMPTKIVDIGPIKEDPIIKEIG